MLFLKITDVHGREVLDSRGNPTVEAEVEVVKAYGIQADGFRGCGCYTEEQDENGKKRLAAQLQVTPGKRYIGRAIVPSGASTGKYEAAELRDEDGSSVMKAVTNVNTELREALLNHNALEQAQLDRLMVKLDGTENKSRLGANAILAVSMAAAKAAANALEIPLYQYLGGIHGHRMPVPMMNILNGGVHAKNTVDFQEFMIMPVNAHHFGDALKMGVKIYHQLKKLLEQDKKSTAVGDEGGFAPDLKDSFEVFDYLMSAVEKAGFKPGKDVVFAMDAAASELYQEDAGYYFFPGETEVKRKENPEIKPDTEKFSVMRNTDEMIAYYEKLCEKYPLVSIEDALHEEDWDGWKQLTERLGSKIQLVGDDLFVTNGTRLKKGIQEKTANAILVKVNQIGTLTEAFEAVDMAHKAGYRSVISHRSGETEDTTIADIAVALNAGQIKTGAPCRTDRTGKYNQLLRIEENMHGMAEYVSPFENSENKR